MLKLLFTSFSLKRRCECMEYENMIFSPNDIRPAAAADARFVDVLIFSMIKSVF